MILNRFIHSCFTTSCYEVKNSPGMREGSQAESLQDLEAKRTDDTSVIVKYIEFYAGIGGWTMAMISQEDSTFKTECWAALDHSDLCINVFHHNFGVASKTTRIENISIELINEWDCDVWLMSPPCQPHTRQHCNQHKDLQDPRSASFLHICDLLEKTSRLPSLIVLENVIGFESSMSCHKWRKTLAHRNYLVCHFELSPTDVGIPNDRPRYFCVALRRERVNKDGPLASYCVSENFDEPVEKMVQGLTSFHVPASVSMISEYVDPGSISESLLRIPKSVLNRNSSWCFDIVTPSSTRSACFTSSYGKFVRGTGSILYSGNKAMDLESPESRKYDSDWLDGIDAAQELRYFSGTELSRLFGFSPQFSFPHDVSLKQQWKLIGNSLNVKVASALLRLAFASVNLNTQS